MLNSAENREVSAAIEDDHEAGSPVAVVMSLLCFLVTAHDGEWMLKTFV